MFSRGLSLWTTQARSAAPRAAGLIRPFWIARIPQSRLRSASTLSMAAPLQARSVMGCVAGTLLAVVRLAVHLAARPERLDRLLLSHDGRGRSKRRGMSHCNL